MNESLDLLNALLVTVIGMAVVFFGLVVLIFLIKLLVSVTSNAGKKKEAPKPAVAVPAPVAVQEAAVEEEAADEGELIAVITAAIAMMMEDNTGFTVRHVRRVSNAAAWQKAGREEQVYSHF